METYAIYRVDFYIKNAGKEPTEKEITDYIDNATNQNDWKYETDFVELRDAENYITENMESLELSECLGVECWHGAAYEIAEMCGGEYIGSYSLTTPKSKN